MCSFARTASIDPSTVSNGETLVPYMAASGEVKTKPTQHSVKELLSIGIQPDILICRSDRAVPANERAKIALFCKARAGEFASLTNGDFVAAVFVAGMSVL